MGKSLINSTLINPLKISHAPKSVLPILHQKVPLPLNSTKYSHGLRGLQHGFRRISYFTTTPTRTLCPKAVLSEFPNEKQYSKVGAESTGPIASKQLLEVVEIAAKTGAEVVMDAVNKPRNITYKGLTDLVTDTDKMSEAAILGVVKENFKDHLILGEEGGIIGNTSSDYLWCIDPLDGTTNFAHGYPSFAVSVGVLFRGKPAAAAVVEFVGGPMCWNTRTFSASAGGGAFCNGEKIHVSQTDQVERSLLVTGFGYEHDEAWATNIDLFKEFTDVSRGVRRLGAAAVDMCHVALGIVESYWEYRLKPWDMAAGVLIVEEAGGTVTRMDGGGFCVFDRSVLVSNGILHSQVLTSRARLNLLPLTNILVLAPQAYNNNNKRKVKFPETNTPDGSKIKSLTLKTKGLNVIWGGSSTNERYWKRAENGEALELVGVYWLEVSGKLPIGYLSQKTRYKLYFNIKLLPGAEGWDNYPVFFNLRLPGQKSKQTSMKLSGLPPGQWKRVPEAGLEINLDQVSVTSSSSAITFAMYEIECEDLKKGLVIKEVIIEMVEPSV